MFDWSSYKSKYHFFRCIEWNRLWVEFFFRYYNCKYIVEGSFLHFSSCNWPTNSRSSSTNTLLEDEFQPKFSTTIYTSAWCMPEKSKPVILITYLSQNLKKWPNPLREHLSTYLHMICWFNNFILWMNKLWFRLCYWEIIAEVLA